MTLVGAWAVAKGAVGYWREILIAALLAFAGAQTIRLERAHTQIAETDAERVTAIAEGNARAELLAGQLAVSEAKVLGSSDKTAATAIAGIRHVKTPDTACPDDERMRLGSHGVRDLLQGVGVAPAEAGSPDAAVRRP